MSSTFRAEVIFMRHFSCQKWKRELEENGRRETNTLSLCSCAPSKMRDTWGDRLGHECEDHSSPHGWTTTTTKACIGYTDSSAVCPGPGRCTICSQLLMFYLLLCLPILEIWYFIFRFVSFPMLPVFDRHIAVHKRNGAERTERKSLELSLFLFTICVRWRSFSNLTSQLWLFQQR